jgi:HD-GYP domain-containing protein (c-di-GMP phosphodiesterase class II)
VTKRSTGDKPAQGTGSKTPRRPAVQEAKMIINPEVPLHRLILSLSEALDHVHPKVADHQQRVAYIAMSIARQMGFDDQTLVDLFHAAALHDIGLVSTKSKITALVLGQLEKVARHPEVGYNLLKDNQLFASAAEIVRYHHVDWLHGTGAERGGRPVPLASHVLAVADGVEIMIDRQHQIIQQVPAILDRITALSGRKYHPDCVAAFREAARPEAFWLDATSPRIYGILLTRINWPTLSIDEVALRPIAEMLAQIVDAASPWTAVHTAGVSATAVALAERMNFSPRELHLMRAAGYLHDLGKLCIPARILDKPGRLTPEEMNVVRTHTYHTFRILETIGGMPQIAEWAAFHHERLDGRGYPFRHGENELTLGARIMAAADIFTAVTEDRPYRKAMTTTEAGKLLSQLAADGGLDREVVRVATTERDEINAVRRREQAEYGKRQRRLMEAVQLGSEDAVPDQAPALCAAGRAE